MGFSNNILLIDQILAECSRPIVLKPCEGVVDGQYKFRWVDVGTAGSCSDAQIFKASQLKRRIEDGRIGFPDPAPITQGGRDVPYFILADDAFALKTWLMKPYGRRLLTREERIANYRISRGRRVVETLLASWFQDSE